VERDRILLSVARALWHSSAMARLRLRRIYRHRLGEADPPAVHLATRAL